MVGENRVGAWHLVVVVAQGKGVWHREKDVWHMEKGAWHVGRGRGTCCESSLNGLRLGCWEIFSLSTGP